MRQQGDHNLVSFLNKILCGDYGVPGTIGP